VILVLEAFPLVDQVSVFVHSLLGKESGYQLVIFAFNRRCDQLNVVVRADH